MQKLAMLLTVTCLVLDQSKHQKLWLTTCQGGEENGKVVLDQRIVKGQAVEYKSFIVDGDDVIHGHILKIGDPQPIVAKLETSSDTGKQP